MAGHYKLVIHNKSKVILKEELSQFKFKDLTDFTSDMFKLTTGTLQATVLSLGAQLEYSFISRNIKTFADLKSVNEKFQKKIETAEKIYQDAIPESVRKDVDTLYNLTNPGAFIGKKLIDVVSNTETLDTYVPFWWFTKYVISGKFFETDVKNFGSLKIFGKDIKFNNIIWYRTWLYKDLILNNWDNLTRAINEGYFTNSGIQELNGINNMDELVNRYPAVSLFITGTGIIRTLMRPIDEITSYVNNFDAERYTNFAQLRYYLTSNASAYEAAKISERSGAATADELSLIAKYEEKKAKFDSESRALIQNFTSSSAGLFFELSNLLPNLTRIISGDDFVSSLGNVTSSAATVAWNILVALAREIPIIGPMIPPGIGAGPGGSAPIQISSHILKIKNNQKFLFETNEKNVKSENVKKISNDQKVERLKSAIPNDAELVIIEKLMNNKKLKKYTEQWLEFVKLTKSISGKNVSEQNKLFFEMLKFSMDYFGKIQTDLNQSLQDLSNEQTDIAQDVNKELKNKFQFDMNPQGFATKLSHDFEILCTLTRTTANAYLTDAEFTLKQFDVIFEFLKSGDIEKCTLLANDLKNQINKKLNFILNDKDINKKFEEIDKSITKIFDKDSRTYEEFKKSQTDLFNNLKSTKINIEKILDSFLKGINEFKDLKKLDKLNALISLIDEFMSQTNNTISEIYEKFLPKLIGLKNMFEKDLNTRRFKLKKDFDELLKKMDQKSFDLIYTENKQKLDVILNNIFQTIGQSKESGPLIKKIEELKQIKAKYIEELEKEQTTQQSDNEKNVEEEDKNTDEQKEQKASLKINKGMKTLNPINIQNDEEE
jgi:hypothetical protein